MTADPDRLAAAVRAGDRRALARAITLMESTRADHRERAEAVLERLLPDTGRSLRIAISGAPGVGKSSFIEAFGQALIAAGHRVAVLAVDPSSQRGGGAILGDKTRMEGLARAEAAFIRPSPAGSALGGVARRTREALLLCEAAGFDRVLVETVGVGQSETAAAGMTDLFLLLLQPGAGDELQGLKRGVVELADLLVVTKADGALLPAARETAAEYRRALHLLRPRQPGLRVPVLLCSALQGTGLDAVTAAIAEHQAALGPAEIAARRRQQSASALWADVAEGLEQAFRGDPAVAAALPDVERRLAAGALTPGRAAALLLARFGRGRPS